MKHKGGELNRKNHIAGIVSVDSNREFTELLMKRFDKNVMPEKISTACIELSDLKQQMS